MSPEIAIFFILIPFLSGVMCLLAPKLSKLLLAASSIVIVYGSVSFLLNDQGAQSYAFTLSEHIGLQFHLSLNGLNAIFLCLSGVFLYLSNSFTSHAKGTALLLFMSTFVHGALLASDLLLFFIFFELMIIPGFFLLGMFGGKEKISTGIYFMVFSAVGSLIMFSAILYIGGRETSSATQHTFLLSSLITDTRFTSTEESLLMLAFLFSFAVKTPLFLFHTWQPMLYRNLPRSGCLYMASIISKVGLYGTLRIVLQLFPNAFSLYGGTIALVAVVGSLCAALIAWKKEDIITVLAYSSIAHLTLCFYGISANTPTALHGVFITMVSHTLVTGGLFYLLFCLEKANGSIPFGGVASKAKSFSSLFMILSLASVAVPLSGSFIGEFLIFVGAFKIFPSLTLCAVFTTVLSSLYMLKLLKRFLFGVSTEEVKSLSLREVTVGGVLCAAVVLVGLYPTSVMTHADEALSSILTTGSMKMIGNREEFILLKEPARQEVFQGVSYHHD